MLNIGIKHRSVDCALDAPHYVRRNMAAAGWRRPSPSERSVGILWMPKASSAAGLKYDGMCIMADAPGVITAVPNVPKPPPPPSPPPPPPSHTPSELSDVPSDDPEAPPADDPEEEAPPFGGWTEDVLEMVHKLKRGRGATHRIGKYKVKYVKRVVKELYWLAQRHGVSELSDVLVLLQAKTSTFRDELMQDWSEKDHSLGETTSRQKMETLKLIMEACCDWSSVFFKDCVGIVVLRNAIARKQREYAVTVRDKRARFAVTEHHALFTQDGAALPKEVLMATGPSWRERAELHRELLPQVLLELEQRMSNGQSIKTSSRADLRLTESDTLLQFKCFFLISESVPPQRKTPWQTVTWTANPPVPFGPDGLLDTVVVEGLPMYLVYHPKHKLYGLSQWHTKVGMCLWLPLPTGIQSLVKLYLQVLERAYAASPKVKVPQREELALFPSQRGTPRQDEQFRTWEKEGFKDIGLQGASVFNARHALTRHLIEQGITPSSEHADLADSFCAAMQTSTRHVFGEKRARDWGLAPYNMALEASSARRAEEALQKYAQWLFVEPAAGKRRVANPVGPPKKKKKKKK